MVFVPLVVLALGLIFSGAREPRRPPPRSHLLASPPRTRRPPIVVGRAASSRRSSIWSSGAAAERAWSRGGGWWRGGIRGRSLAAGSRASWAPGVIGAPCSRQGRSARRSTTGSSIRMARPEALERYFGVRSSPRLVAVGARALVRRLRRDAALLAVASSCWRALPSASSGARRLVRLSARGLLLCRARALIGAASARRARVLWSRSFVARARRRRAHVGRAPAAGAILLRASRRASRSPLRPRRARPRRAPGHGALVTDHASTSSFRTSCAAGLPAFEEWQVAFVDRSRGAQAAAILAGGPDGRRSRRASACGYAVADPGAGTSPPRGCAGRRSSRTTPSSSSGFRRAR